VTRTPTSLPRVLPERIFHVVEEANWPSVQRDGLLPARSLLDRALGPTAGPVASRTHRPRALDLPCGTRLRDQAPMPPALLARCLLPPLTPEDWYALVNAGVYFWTREDRLRRHLSALRRTKQRILVLDGPRLAAAYRDQAFVTPFNVGSARRRPSPRGPATFVAYAAWHRTAWRTEHPAPASGRPPSHPPAELVIRAPIPDAMGFVTDILSADIARQAA